MSQRRTKMDRSNFFYKLLYERNTLGTMPVSIYNSAKNNRYLLQRLSLERELNVHSGCVNTICWNSTGQYLLSGSDDLHLCITDAFTGELRSKIRTGHVTNIFSAKYLPNTNDSQVISCSGDGVIIYTDLNRPESSHKNIFDCQEESVYDIATVPNDSHTFLTCSHDRTVRWYDLRVKTSCLKHPSYSRFARRSLQHKCNDDVLIRCEYPVTAIAVNSLMPWQLSIGCSDSIIRIYDRRMLTTTSLGGYLGDQDQSVLAKFTYNGLKNPNRITSLAYSRNCQQILASYSNDHLYLFDINDVKKTIEFGLERDIIPDKSQKQSCSFKRFRLRGDWSDTGPNAMTTNELRSTVSASVAAATAAAAAVAASADTPLATTNSNTSTTGSSVPASSSSVASFSASVANNSSSFYAAQPQSSQITTTAAQSSSDLTESASAQRAITTTTTNTTTTTTDSAEPNNRSSAARLRNLNTILSLILRSSFSRRSGGEEGAADAPSSADVAPSSDDQEQPNDVVPMLLDDLEPSTVSEHLTNNDSVSLPSIASMSGADSDYSRPYPHHHHHHHQHSHLNATSSQPASPSPSPLTSPLASTTSAATSSGSINPFSSLPQPQPPSLSTLAQRYQLDDFLLDSVRARRTTSTTAPATTPSATSPLATTASPTPVSTNSRSSSSPPDTVTTPSNNASRYFLQFFDPAPFPNFLNRFDDEEEDDDEEDVPELGARWPPAESSVPSNRTNDGSSSNNNNNNNDSTMATNASTPNTTTTTTTTSNNLEDNQSYNNIRHSHYIADLGDDIDSDTTNDSVFNHAGSDSLQAPVPLVRNLVTGRQRSRSSSSNDSPRNFLYHHQLPSSIPNSASSLVSGHYPSSTNNNNSSSGSNPTLNRASERRNLRNINRTRLRNPTTAQATQQRLNRLRDSLGGGGGSRNFDELMYMDDEDEDQESDIMHNPYYHSPYLHHPDSYHHFINQSYQPPTSTSSSTNNLNNRGTSQTPPSSSSSQAKRLKTYKIRDYKTFVGHRNSRTVIKEATFWGDDYIVSGSDCGHIFFWSIKTCELVMIMEGDLHVVNCLQPHPTDPILASSGIDYNIKLWSPMSEENQFDENRAKTIISRNERMLEENRDTVTVPARFVLSLFSSIRNRQHPVRSQPFSVPQSGGNNNNNNNNNNHHHHDSSDSVAASPNLAASFSPWMRESNAPSTGSISMQPDVTPDDTSVGPRNVEVEVEDDDEDEEDENAWLPTSGDILVAVEDELDDEFEEDELMPANDDHDDDEDDADIERIPL